MRKPPKPCRETGCEYPKFAGKQRCVWHWMLAQPIEVQIARADARLAAHEGPLIKRVPPAEWPPGERWCSGCQSFVPVFYVSGSRCKACNSRAAHASHVAREYGIPPEDYERLLAWQGGKCYICLRVPRSRRLAVDHDHGTGRVRGLLCADSDRGCNHAILGNITSLDMARRIVQYLEKTPYDRMLAGEELPALARDGVAHAPKTGIQIRMPPTVDPEPLTGAAVRPGDRRGAGGWQDDPAWSL